MPEERKLIGKQYQDLYAGYYANPSGTLLKRQISAVQSVECITSALAGRTFDKLLDVGAGDGNVLAELNGKNIAREMFALEISESGINAIKSRNIPSLRDIQSFDGYKIPYPDKHFDMAIAVHVLEHVEHERLFLKEISRVSRHVCIEVPLEHGFRIQRSIDRGKKYGHINFYTKETLQNMLESSGLKVLECNIVASSLRYEQHLSGRTKGWIKNAVRNAALAIAPTVAPWFVVYNGFAYCECK